MRWVLTTVLVVSTACSATRRYEVSTPVPALGPEIVIVEEDGDRRVFTEGRIETVSGERVEIPAYLRDPAEERAAISAVEYERKCGLIGGPIGALLAIGVGAAVGYSRGERCDTSTSPPMTCGKGVSAIAGGVVGAVFSAPVIWIGSELSKTFCSEPRPAEIE